jgi:tetratricopeptide (TPR) repeat protein
MFISTTRVFAATAMVFILNCSTTLAQTPCNSQAGPPCPPATATAAPHKTYDMLEADAKANIAKGDFQAALTDIGYLFDMHKPDTVGQLTFMRAEALLGTRDFLRADEAVRAAENADRNLMQKVGQRHFYFIRGAISDGLKNILDAQQAYMQAVGLPPTSPMDAEQRHDLIFSYYRLAYIASEIGQYDEGMGYIGNVLRLAGDDGNGYFLRGKLKAGLKDYDSAIADYNKAETLNASGDFHLLRGIAYKEKASIATESKDPANASKNLANAIKDFTISIAAHPDSEESYLNRGIAYQGMSDDHPEYTRLAFADLDKAQQLNSDDFIIYLYRGEFHFFDATKNPKIRVAEASLATAAYQAFLRLAKSRPFTGSQVFVEMATARLEQINKLLGRPTKSTK